MNDLQFLCFTSILIPWLLALKTGAVPISTPYLSSTVKESSEGFSQFLTLWEYSLNTDSKLTGHTRSTEPKTLLLPGDFSMAHLVPLDGTHPLFLDDPKHRALRREFILDHLVSESIPFEVGSGVTTVTLSGKEVLISKDDTGNVLVNKVRVKKMVSLTDGSQIYVLMKPLFNQTQKVRKAFDEYHQIKMNDPVGPPLDIPFLARVPVPHQVEIARPPAPPQGKIALPPAPPKGKIVQPTALPKGKIAQPPAPPTGKIAQPPAPPK